MSSSGKYCANPNCRKPAATKSALYCEKCGGTKFIFKTKETGSKPKTNKPTKKELASQLHDLQTKYSELEKALQERCEDLNKKSIKLDRLQRFADPQALEDAQEKIMELEYSNYLLDEELACIKIDLSDAERISSEALNRYQKLLADAQQDIVEFNFYMDLLVADAEEQALEVFDEYQKPIEAQFEPVNEEEKGGETAMMKPRPKKKIFRTVVLVILILGLLITIQEVLNNPNLKPSPTPITTIASTPKPTPTLKPTLEPTANPTIAPTVEPTSSPTVTPTVSPTPTPKILNQTTPKRLETTKENVSLIFNRGDTVVSQGCIELINGEKYPGRYVIYNSPFEGIVTNGIVNPNQQEITDETVINP